MRRSFWSSGGHGHGGGGGMIRAVGRAMGASATKPRLTSSTTNMFSVSSSSSTPSTSVTSYSPVGSSTTATISSGGSNGYNGVPSSPWHSSSSFFSEFDDHEWDWVNGGGEEDYEDVIINDRYVFGQVPSVDEVESAVSAIQHILAPASYAQFIEDGISSGSEMDWLEPSVYLFNQRMIPSHRNENVYDAFHLLQTDPSIQRMVVSLSSDRAVWEAVLNNEVVRELRDSYAVDKGKYNGPEGNDVAAKSILMSILKNTKEKVMELIEKITKFANEVFQPSHGEKEPTTSSTTNQFDKAIRSSLMLSVIVLLVVIVTRAVKA
ncbi:hypothetical protein GIB67_036521 [Kingdonia uniflora]|uniref:Uncharacterized protein n=1 Tax=Kingdonia uniflora TaxID=39325 RepID=A0A7J7P7W7_9MAGN|nr:hypothetical protein GIB67_036521 [Kingdonia uniflora]